jgi:hypothetical protein
MAFLQSVCGFCVIRGGTYGDKREKEGGFLLRFSSRMIGDGGGGDGN